MGNMWDSTGGVGNFGEFGELGNICGIREEKPIRVSNNMFSTGYRKDEAMIGLMELARTRGLVGLGDAIVSVVGMDFIANHPTEIYSMDNIDTDLLTKLNFNSQDIAMLKVARLFNCYSTVSIISRKFCIEYNDAAKIKYMDDIITGRIAINSNDDLALHISRMYNGGRRLSTSDLSLSSINDIPRKVAVFGIKAERFKLFNSNTRGYKKEARIYDVVKVTQNNVHCIVHKRPIIKYTESLEEEGVCRIIRVIDKHTIEVAFSKNHCILCNKYIIVATLKKPEMHCGMIEIICKDGTQVYVYAQMVTGDKQINYYSGNQRIYDYGFFGNELRSKLMKSAERVYRNIGGIISSAYEPTVKFMLINSKKAGSHERCSRVEKDIDFDKL